LKNHLRKWFFKEAWFERFYVKPEMVPSRTISLKVLIYLYRFFKELFKEMVL